MIETDNNSIDMYQHINVNHFTGVNYRNIGFKYKKNFNIIYFNIQSLRNKLDNLELLINSYKCNIHCVVLTEIWLNKSENIFFNLQGYTAYFSNRQCSYGGVAIFIKDGISSTQIFEEEFNKSSFLVVKLLKQNINIISIYRSHETQIEEFVSKLDEYTTKYKNSLILGDFNINLLNESNSDVKYYSNTLLSNGFIIYNKVSLEFATRIAKTSSTIIDHFITDVLKNEYYFHILDTSLSDHQYFLLSMNFKPFMENHAQFQTILNYDNIEKDEIWAKLNSYNNFNDIVNDFQDLITRNTRKTLIKKGKKKHEWITNEILEKIKIRDSYHKYRKKYFNDPHVEKLYTDSKKEVIHLITEAKRKYYCAEVTRIHTNSQKLWNLYKKVMFNKDSPKQNSNIKLLKHGNQTYTTETDIAECMNHFFVNVTNELNFPSDPHDYQYLNNFSRSFSYNFNLSPTNVAEVKLAIDSLKPAAATGYDSISSKFIKKFSNKIAPIFVKFINISFENFSFPNSLKTAIVTPIFKSGITTNTSNYRPISVLSAFSKIFEIIIKQRLNYFMMMNDFLSKEQYGFEKNSNTSAACLSLTHFISKNMDEGNYVACVFLDFQKAFDSVDHEVLLYKLKKMNLNLNQIEFFRSYLNNRQQKVRVNDTLSQPKINKKGVPQGSILGPDLFKIYINDISYLNLKGQIQLYADDAVLKYYSKDEGNLRKDIENDFKIIEQWLKKHYLLLNIKKSKILLFENKKFMSTLFQCNNETIETVKQFNYLGLILDSKLKWCDHVENIIRKISPYIFILRRLRKYLDNNSLYQIYSSYIKSNITYLNCIWSKAPQSTLNKLDIIHKKSIKIIHNYSRVHPTTMLYNERYISLNDICRYELYITAFKIINNYIKHHFILNRMIDIHSYNTRNKSNFYLTLFKTNNQRNNCLYNCLKLFNDLPTELKNIENIGYFKKEIKTFLFS